MGRRETRRNEARSGFVPGPGRALPGAWILIVMAGPSSSLGRRRIAATRYAHLRHSGYSVEPRGGVLSWRGRCDAGAPPEEEQFETAVHRVTHAVTCILVEQFAAWAQRDRHHQRIVAWPSQFAGSAVFDVGCQPRYRGVRQASCDSGAQYNPRVDLVERDEAFFHCGFLPPVPAGVLRALCFSCPRLRKLPSRSSSCQSTLD